MAFFSAREAIVLTIPSCAFRQGKIPESSNWISVGSYMVARGKSALCTDDLSGRYGLDFIEKSWVRGLDLNQRPSGYEPDELPGCSTPRQHSLSRGLLAPEPIGSKGGRGIAARAGARKPYGIVDSAAFFACVRGRLARARDALWSRPLPPTGLSPCAF